MAPPLRLSNRSATWLRSPMLRPLRLAWAAAFYAGMLVYITCIHTLFWPDPVARRWGWGTTGAAARCDHARTDRAPASTATAEAGGAAVPEGPPQPTGRITFPIAVYAHRGGSYELRPTARQPCHIGGSRSHGSRVPPMPAQPAPPLRPDPDPNGCVPVGPAAHSTAGDAAPAPFDDACPPAPSPLPSPPPKPLPAPSPAASPQLHFIENTIAAFANAVAVGADLLELDVQVRHGG